MDFPNPRTLHEIGEVLREAEWRVQSMTGKPGWSASKTYKGKATTVLVVVGAPMKGLVLFRTVFGFPCPPDHRDALVQLMNDINGAWPIMGFYLDGDVACYRTHVIREEDGSLSKRLLLQTCAAVLEIVTQQRERLEVVAATGKRPPPSD